MAAVLDSHNSSYQNSIANIYLKRQQPDAAINALRELPRGEGIPRIASIQLAQQRYDDAIRTLNGVFGPVAAVTRAKCYSEMGEGSKALSALASATGDEAAVLQAAIELSEERATSGRSVSSPQAVKAVQRMRTNKLAVAQELYARGLLRTAGRVLKAIPDESSEKYLLLANINLAIMPATSSQLEIAKTAATGGVHLDPSNRALHIILRDVDRKLGKTDEATKEEALIKLLIK